MELNEALKILFSLMKNGKPNYHKHYDRTVKLAAEYRALITGEGLDKMIRKHATRESEELFKQRLDITEHITTSISKNLMDILFKVPRSNALKRVLTYENRPDINEVTKEIKGILSRFSGEDDFDKYLSRRFIQLMCIDPNSFIVIEFQPFDNLRERAQPYPYEVFSPAAVDYRYENNVLQYLTVMNSVTLKSADPNNKKTESKNRYTLYLKNQTVVCDPIHSDDLIYSNILFTDEDQLIVIDGISYIKIEKEVYRVSFPVPHNAERVPAFKPGYVPDLSVNESGYYLNPFWAAIPYLKKTLKVNSELDLTMSNSAFPFPIRYVQPCKAIGCRDGILGHNNETCSRCAGTGNEPKPTSSQEELTVRMPKNSEDFVDLDKLLAFKAPPSEILEFQLKYIDVITRAAKQIVFNSDVFDKKQVAETATGKNIDLQNVYDALFPLAEKFSAVWVRGITIIARFTDLDKGIIVNLTFGKDFKLKSLDDLMYDLKSANDSGANPEFKRQINEDIISIIHENRPEEKARYRVIESFNPFSGKTPEEILSFISLQLVPKRQTVFYANSGFIFDELEYEYSLKQINFYELKRADQKIAIYEKVDAIIAELEGDNPEPQAFI